MTLPTWERDRLRLAGILFVAYITVCAYNLLNGQALSPLLIPLTLLFMAFTVYDVRHAPWGVEHDRRLVRAVLTCLCGVAFVIGLALNAR